MDHGGVIEKIHTREHQSATLYPHRWEINPGQPKIQAVYKLLVKCCLNFRKTEDKLKNLLGKLKFGIMREVVGTCVPLYEP